MAFKEVYRTALDETWSDAADGDPIGDLRWEGNKCYKCVQFNNGAGDIASIAGYAASYYAVSGSSSATTGYLSNIVTMDRTDTHGGAGGIGAGIFQAVMADGDFGWVQIKGQALLISTAFPSGSDGDAMTMVDGAGDGFIVTANADSEPIIGFADDASLFQLICDFPF